MNGNNFYTGVADGPRLDQGDVNSQLFDAKVEDIKAKQTGSLPDPLSKIAPIISNMFSDLVNVNSMIKQSANNPAVNKNIIRSLSSRIDDINKKVLDLYNDISKLSI